jgi:hypothetical protein
MLADEVLHTVPTTTDQALAVFDAADPVDVDSMFGTWRGAEVPTSHPLDGLLAASGWWGKRFVDAERVDPLLFPAGDGRSLWACNPTLAFGGLKVTTLLPALRTVPVKRSIAALRPLLSTSTPKARVRTTRFRGVDTATMIYDQLPINDVFRRLGEDAVIGAMDLRGIPQPYFFVLRRDASLPVA